MSYPVDAHAIAGALDAAFEHLRHTELLADLFGGEGCVPELLHGSAGDDLHGPDLA